VHRHVAPQVLADVFLDVLLVLPGQRDVADADAPGGQDLLLDAADRSTFPLRVISRSSRDRPAPAGR